MLRSAVTLLVLLSPAAALAQEAVPAPDTIFEPAEELTDPTGPLSTPEGYGDLTLPQLSPRTTPTGRVRVDVLGWGPRRLTLHAQPAGPDVGTTERCTAPCRLNLEPGRYLLSVQPHGAGPRRADDQPVWISGGHLAVQMSYDHRVGLRSLGWTFLMMGLSAFAVSWVGGLFGALIIGLPIAAAFMIPAAPLIFLEDSARVQTDVIVD